MVKCTNGANIDDLVNVCKIITNIKTDKDIINIRDLDLYSPSFYKFIKKNDETHFEIRKNENLVFLNVEIFSGNISISSNASYKYTKYNSKILYIFSKNLNGSSYITIRGIEDSVYSMFDYYYYLQDYCFVPIGMNYLINIANNLVVKPYDIFNSRTEVNCKYYFRIFPINCNLLVTGSAIYFYTEKNYFYQNILTPRPNDRGHNSHILYNINHTYTCLYYISTFEFANKYGITLGNNTSQNFSFNKNLKKLHFSYPNTNINEEVNITIKLLNESNYNVNLYLNDDHIDEYYINRNKHILINPETLKKQLP